MVKKQPGSSSCRPLTFSKRITPVSILLLVLFLAMTLVLACPGKVHAAKGLVVDLAGVFTETQEEQLEQSALQLGTQYAMDLVIVTTENAEGKKPMEYADDYFDYNGYGVGSDRDGLLFLIDFDNGEIYISTSGSGIKYLTDARIDSILDDVMNAGSVREDSFGAARTFLSSTAAFLAAGIPVTPPNTLSALDIILGMAASGLLGGGFFAGTKSQYKGKPGRAIFEYQKNSFVNLGIVTDNLTNTFVTSRAIPRANGPGGMGGSSTHTSSSGRTHGGGGRKF